MMLKALFTLQCLPVQVEYSFRSSKGVNLAYAVQPKPCKQVLSNIEFPLSRFGTWIVTAVAAGDCVSSIILYANFLGQVSEEKYTKETFVLKKLLLPFCLLQSDFEQVSNSFMHQLMQLLNWEETKLKNICDIWLELLWLMI